MARQAGPIYLLGTIDDVTYYKMDGEYLARKKSSLDRKQFRTDPRFARSRQSAKAFGEASTLASQIYWQLPKEQRGKGVVNQLTKQVGQLLKEGKSTEEITKHFQQQYQHNVTKPATQLKDKQSTPVKANASTWKVTPSGQLICAKFAPAISNKHNDCLPASTVLNVYSEPQLVLGIIM